MKTIVRYSKILLVAITLLIATNVRATIHVIQVEGIIFNPAAVPSVHIGDTIRWTWVSGTHTTTSTTIPAGAATWNNPISSTNTTFDYIPTIAGVYNYQCNIHVSMGMIGSFTVSNPAGVMAMTNSASISIYPNPFYNNVTFQFSSADTFLRNLMIFDITGKLWKTFVFPEQPGKMETTLDLTDIESGMYLFEFIDNHNNLYSRRVIRQ